VTIALVAIKPSEHVVMDVPDRNEQARHHSGRDGRGQEARHRYDDGRQAQGERVAKKVPNSIEVIQRAVDDIIYLLTCFT